MKTIYLNVRYSTGVETVDEFTRGSDNAPEGAKEFRLYVNQMVKEYHLAGIQVYKSQRSTNDWKNK